MPTINNIAGFDATLGGMLNDQIAQEINVFNAAGGNAFIIRGKGEEGSFISQKARQLLDGAVKRRDIDGVAAAVTTDYTRAESKGVKIGAYSSIVIPDAILRWQEAAMTPAVAEAITDVAEQMAQLIIKDQLNAGIRMLVGSMDDAGSGALYESAADVDIKSLNAVRKQFGDRGQALTVTVMHSSMYGKLVDAALDKNDVLFSGGDTLTISSNVALGGKVIVTDSPELLFNDGADKYRVLCLQVGAIEFTEYNHTVVSETDISKENNTSNTKFEFDYVAKLLGTSYTGPRSPLDAELATYANYTRITNTVKNTSGVMGSFLDA